MNHALHPDISSRPRSVSPLAPDPAAARMAVAILALLLLLTGISVTSMPVAADPATDPVREKVVNINTADASTLAVALRGVGESRAREIIRHRETYGPFASPEELLEVKGIGKSTLEQNRSRITLE